MIGKVGDIVEVEWKDATQKTISKELLKNVVDYINLCPINKTYGKLLVNEDAVIVLHEDSDFNDEIDVTIIPSPWILSISKK